MTIVPSAAIEYGTLRTMEVAAEAFVVWRGRDGRVRSAPRRCPHLDHDLAEGYVVGDELVLGPYLGKPSPHTRIPLGRGICGAAATEKATIVVDDVNSDPRYLACSVETRSEIVVPVIRDAQVLAEIDIDSDMPAAFGEQDRRLVEAAAAMLAGKL